MLSVSLWELAIQVPFNVDPISERKVLRTNTVFAVSVHTQDIDFLMETTEAYVINAFLVKS